MSIGDILTNFMKRCNGIEFNLVQVISGVIVQ